MSTNMIPPDEGKPGCLEKFLILVIVVFVIFLLIKIFIP